MLKKRLRMVLDFEVVIEELTDETLHSYYRQFTNYEETIEDLEFWANIRRQIRLQRALLEDESTLRRFLTHVVVDEVDASLDSRLGEVFGVEGLWVEEDILGPLFSQLGHEDENFFVTVSEDGALFENVEVLNFSFKSSLTGAALFEETSNAAEGILDDREK